MMDRPWSTCSSLPASAPNVPRSLNNSARFCNLELMKRTHDGSGPSRVELRGFGTSTTVFASEQLRLRAVASFSACSTVSVSSKVTFTWEETTKAINASVLAILVARDPTLLAIPAGTLSAGHSYVFRVTVQIEGHNASDVLTVNCIASNIFAAIDGGTGRLQVTVTSCVTETSHA